MTMVKCARGMLYRNTPVEDHTRDWGLFVKREDLACPPPGPPFSKTRGVYAWVAKQTAPAVGVLDTYHSQGGHAVARACQLLGKACWLFWPKYKADTDALRPQQVKAAGLGASLYELPAGRSAVLYHQAKKMTLAAGGVMIPNALKLDESVEETAREVPADAYDNVLIPASSGTIAAGVIRGFSAQGRFPRFIIHLGYSRSHGEVLKYLAEASGVSTSKRVELVDEKYAYKDEARPGPTPPWPANAHYDLKTVRWWTREGRASYPGRTLLWNIG